MFVVYLLGLKWLNDPFASFLAAIATGFSFTIVDTSILGLSEPLFMLLTYLSIYNFYRYEYTLHKSGLILSGFFCGLSYLTRANGVAIATVIVLFILLSNHNRKSYLTKISSIFIFLAVVLIVTSPWLIRNMIIFKDPFHFAGRFYLGISPNKTPLKIFAEIPTFANYWGKTPLSEIIARYINRVPSVVLMVFSETHIFLILAIGGSFVLVRKRKPFLLFLFFFLINFIFPLMHPGTKSRYFITMAPIIYLSGAYFLSVSVKRFLDLENYFFLMIPSLILIIGLYAFFYVSPRLTKAPDSALYQIAGEWLREHSPPNAVIMSARVPDIAYYSKRPVIMNPRNLMQRGLDEMVNKYDIQYYVHFRTNFGVTAPSGFKIVKPFEIFKDGYYYHLILYQRESG